MAEVRVMFRRNLAHSVCPRVGSSTLFLDVKGCLNAVLKGAVGYGESPCFLGVWFLWVFGPDWLVYNLVVDNGVEYLD